MRKTSTRYITSSSPIARAAGIALLAAVAIAGAHAQTAPPKPQLPQRIVYWQLFRHVNFLEQQADLADQRGQGGSSLRNYYQQRANLTATETAILKQTASNTATAVQTIDAQIQAVVVQFRAGFKPSSKTDIPAPPSQLTTLQAQRDKAITDHVSSLQSGLGPARFQQFDTYVQTRFAPHITLTKPIPAPPSDPTKLPPPPAH